MADTLISGVVATVITIVTTPYYWIKGLVGGAEMPARNRKLGKRAARRDPRTLKMSCYLNPKLPTPPDIVDYTQGIKSWGMMANDELGCCTIAALGHAVQTWTLNGIGRELTVPDTTIKSYYAKWDGWVPGDPSTDGGGVEIDVLKKFQQQGFDGERLDAFASIHETGGSPDVDLTATAIWLFGGAYLGVELPTRAQSQDVWDLPASCSKDDDPGSWGGHAIYLVAVDRVKRTFTCITWGKLQVMTFAWFERYCSEAYALVSESWLKSTGVAPNGFDLASLLADLRILSS